MTIDKAIKHAKEISCKNSKCYQYCTNDCSKCEEYHEQLAEWLEELKERRRMMKEYGHCGYVEAEIRNKAIQDFAEKLKEYIDASMLQRVTELETGQALMELMDFSIDKITKQLKEGREQQ